MSGTKVNWIPWLLAEWLMKSMGISFKVVKDVPMAKVPWKRYVKQNSPRLGEQIDNSTVERYSLLMQQGSAFHMPVALDMGDHWAILGGFQRSAASTQVDCTGMDLYSVTCDNPAMVRELIEWLNVSESVLPISREANMLLAMDHQARTDDSNEVTAAKFGIKASTLASAKLEKAAKERVSNLHIGSRMANMGTWMLIELDKIVLDSVFVAMCRLCTDYPKKTVAEVQLVRKNLPKRVAEAEQLAAVARVRAEWWAREAAVVPVPVKPVKPVKTPKGTVTVGRQVRLKKSDQERVRDKVFEVFDRATLELRNAGASTRAGKLTKDNTGFGDTVLRKQLVSRVREFLSLTHDIRSDE